MKTIMITGASSGIGLATARLFQARGWQVAATARNPESIKELAALERVRSYRLDVTDQASVDAALAACVADFGGIDALVNNAGYAAYGPFEDSGEDQARRQFDTNVFGLMNVTRAVLPLFRARRAGTLVNISSIGGQVTFPLYSLYHATKFAVEGFTESLALELRQFGVRCRLIEPGTIKTDFYGRSMDRSTEALPEDYRDFAGRVMTAMDRFSDSAPGPEIVARRVWRAVNSRGWRLRWLVGREAALVRLKRWLPDAARLGLVRTMLGVH
jgi:NAD(P)-dependent dehydrogenase (short-subunit alcohol dehydrogenase family)